MKTTKSTILLTSGTLYSSQIYQYKTKDGKAIFAFSYEYQPEGYYDIAIHSHPSYNGRSDLPSIAHWLPCDESPIDRKICFTSGKEPETLERAKNFSMQWAELTSTYIRTGITIDDQLTNRN
ncbi:MAG: hypothetical protein QM564_06710 [Bergeyella sp.]